MILRLKYKVFPKTGRLLSINPHPNYVHSINLKEATAWPFLNSQGMAILVKGEHRTYLIIHQEEGTILVYKSS
jgi:hypothetical protein